jgi:hypothetical protein
VLEKARGQWAGRSHWSKELATDFPRKHTNPAFSRQALRHLKTAPARCSCLLLPPRQIVECARRHQKGR